MLTLSCREMTIQSTVLVYCMGSEKSNDLAGGRNSVPMERWLCTAVVKTSQLSSEVCIQHYWKVCAVITTNNAPPCPRSNTGDPAAAADGVVWTAGVEGKDNKPASESESSHNSAVLKMFFVVVGSKLRKQIILLPCWISFSRVVTGLAKVMLMSLFPQGVVPGAGYGEEGTPMLPPHQKDTMFRTMQIFHSNLLQRSQKIRSVDLWIHCSLVHVRGV